MTVFAKRLGAKVAGVFVATLTAVAVADDAFNVLAFDWKTGLTVSGSAAVLALLEGLTARFSGDKDRPNLSR